MRKNYEFYKKLYRLADAPILETMADGLWTRYGPSLRVVCGRVGTLSVADQHKEKQTAMSLCDAGKAAEAFLADVTQGIDQIKSSRIGN